MTFLSLPTRLFYRRFRLFLYAATPMSLLCTYQNQFCTSDTQEDIYFLGPSYIVVSRSRDFCTSPCTWLSWPRPPFFAASAALLATDRDHEDRDRDHEPHPRRDAWTAPVEQ